MDFFRPKELGKVGIKKLLFQFLQIISITSSKRYIFSIFWYKFEHDCENLHSLLYHNPFEKKLKELSFGVKNWVSN